MASTHQPQMARTVAAPQHYAPPSSRELRAQSVHRLLIGLAGLAGMLLLVSLANIIMNRAQQAEGEMRAPQEAKAEGAGSDPLADIGVAPAAVPSGPDSPGKGGN
jgi:lysylphosphatidylglycerol synthetase-like protein (DUF2156 family)